MNTQTKLALSLIDAAIANSQSYVEITCGANPRAPEQITLTIGSGKYRVENTRERLEKFRKSYAAACTLPKRSWVYDDFARQGLRSTSKRDGFTLAATRGGKTLAGYDGVDLSDEYDQENRAELERLFNGYEEAAA